MKEVVVILISTFILVNVTGQPAAQGAASLADLLGQAAGKTGAGSTGTTGNGADSSVIQQNVLDIFGPPPSSTSSPDIQTNVGTEKPQVFPIPGIGGCTCVPYYLCNNNGTINMNGEGIIDIRAKDGPCESYIETCCNKDDQTETPRKPTPSPLKRSGCGYRHEDGVGFRITGDKENESQFGEFPWMVAVLREETVMGSTNKLNVYQCGGALIHPQMVVTAAHCVSGKDKTFKIRAGEWDTQHTQEIYPHQDREVKTVTIHPQYYAGALYNDVAVLYLASPFEIAENVDTICLPPQGNILNTATCFATGWGKDIFGKQGKYQVILKKIDLPIVANDKCQEQLRETRLGKFFQLHRSFLCAGGVPGKDTCKGDGGSPLVCPIPGQNGRYYQMGIVAWGIGCGENNTPGVYVNIPLFRDWIDQQMISFDLDTSAYNY